MAGQLSLSSIVVLAPLPLTTNGADFPPSVVCLTQSPIFFSERCHLPCDIIVLSGLTLPIGTASLLADAAPSSAPSLPWIISTNISKHFLAILYVWPPPRSCLVTSCIAFAGTAGVPERLRLEALRERRPPVFAFGSNASPTSPFCPSSTTPVRTRRVARTLGTRCADFALATPASRPVGRVLGSPGLTPLFFARAAIT